jgi:hypothetical protein
VQDAKLWLLVVISYLRRQTSYNDEDGNAWRKGIIIL